MKKLLSILGAIGLMATSTSGVVSCTDQKEPVEQFTKINGARYLDNGANDMLLDQQDDAYFIQLLKYTASLNLMRQIPYYQQALEEQIQANQEQIDQIGHEDFELREKSWMSDPLNSNLLLPAIRLVVTDWWMEGNSFKAVLDDIKWHDSNLDSEEPPFKIHVSYRYELEITQAIWDAFHIVSPTPQWNPQRDMDIKK